MVAYEANLSSKLPDADTMKSLGMEKKRCWECEMPTEKTGRREESEARVGKDV